MIRIYGCSDDLIEIESDDGKVGEELNVIDPPRATIKLGDDNGGVKVKMKYGSWGCWSATIEQLNEGVMIPWPIRVTQHQNGYSIKVEIDCPSDTPVKYIKVRQ